MFWISFAAALLTIPSAAQSAAEPPSRALLRELTASTRLAGTTGSSFGAKVVARHLAAAGYEVELDSREVLLSLPRKIEIAIHENAWNEVPLSARIDRFDADAIPPGDVPKYNAWTKSGDVRAIAVDAGYGLRADFERLKELGVDVRGTVAIVRYGKSYRGVKVDLAAQYGCAAVLLFDDASRDGAERGPVWPMGPWKPDWEAQRGSISPMGRTPGDPSTPGWPSPAKGEPVRRLSSAELDLALPKIPCIPIGSAEARSILARLAEVDVSAAAEGTPAVRERIGPGPVQVRLSVDVPRELRSVINVIGRLHGESQDFVLAGGHRDAWVRGANDNGAGCVGMLRAAQHLGERAKSGWKPKSGIAFAFWDAEEFGLIGSTEWAEAHADTLRAHALLYVNADVGISGIRMRHASGTPGVLAMLQRVLERNATAPYDASVDASARPANLWEEWRVAIDGGEPRLSLPGSGSDFAVFLHHLSLPVLEVGLGGSSGGQYHTAFDDFVQVDRYLDPGFVGHELYGRLMADLLAEVATLGRASFDAVEAAREMARRAREAGREGGETPWLGTERAERIAVAFESAAEALRPGVAFYPSLALSTGLPDRVWYRNPLWTPGLEDGYGSETFPLLRIAAAKSTEELDREIAVLVASIGRLAPEK